MKKFAVLIRPWAVYAKEWSFFVEQGGLRDSWGKEWVPIMARDLESARRKGYAKDGRRDPLAHAR
jgi:hypothetical protein